MESSSDSGYGNDSVMQNLDLVNLLCFSTFSFFILASLNIIIIKQRDYLPLDQ